MADPEVKWIQFRSYSGPVINAGAPVGPPRSGHAQRAYWLTTKVETGGVLGKVMAYDGTCMTAGPDQHIAVYPKELSEEDWRAEDDQGSLWSLLARLLRVRGSDSQLAAHFDALLSELASDGFRVGTDGRLVYAADRQVTVGEVVVRVRAGELAHGNVIRDTYTGPSDGKVPSSGPYWEKAKRWALLWHRITVHPAARQVQLDYGIDHLVKRTRTRKIADLGTVDAVLYGPQNVMSANGLDPALDLAACVFHAHSVNGPSPAVRALAEAARAHPRTKDPVAFARDLLIRLGNNDYGRWDDDVKSGRWQRTRTHAMNSGLWPERLFLGESAVMPLDLPDEEE